jgi:hypothetical protein
MLKSKIVKRSEILDTILHEIAHALVGHKEAHGPVWVAKAKEIGCSGCPTHSMRFHPATLRPRKRKDMPKKTEDIPASEYEDEDLSELRRFMREFPEEFEDDDYDY